MRLAAAQMVSTPDVDRNLEAASRLIAQAAAQGAGLVALPEYFCIMGRHERDKLGVAEPLGDGPIQRALSEAARRNRVWVIGGTHPGRIDGDPEHAHNRCAVFAPDGTLAAHYDKMHLFRYAGGTEQHDEARVLRAGTRAVAFDAGPWRVGLSVCYDLRFPELYRALMQPPCDLIAVPAAFTRPTGRAHWETLLRARAIENQCYVIAPAQGGVHESGRRTHGHSLIVDPWGEVLGRLEEGEGLVTAEMRRERIDEVRATIPALAHR